LVHCENLVKVHRGHGGSGQGRRAEEVSINRAIVVLSVATWQAVVQDFAESAIDAGAPPLGSTLLSQTYKVIAGRAKIEIQNFSTPNAENTRRLLQGVGFDPRPHWTWTQRGGQGVGMVTIGPADAEKGIREWLRLRHDIAHGHDVLSHVDVLRAVRENPNPAPSWCPTIRLVDAEACMTFFGRLARLTGNALADHLGQPRGLWK
jgi:hypothetical protein